MSAVDTSGDAVERLSVWLRCLGQPHGKQTRPRAGIDARALVRAGETMDALLAERDAARREVERMRAALEKIIKQDWWDPTTGRGDEPDEVDGRCAEIARAALAAPGEKQG